MILRSLLTVTTPYLKSYECFRALKWHLKNHECFRALKWHLKSYECFRALKWQPYDGIYHVCMRHVTKQTHSSMECTWSCFVECTWNALRTMQCTWNALRTLQCNWKHCNAIPSAFHCFHCSRHNGMHWELHCNVLWNALGMHFEQCNALGRHFEQCNALGAVL